MLEVLNLEFPVAELSRKTGYSDGTVSSYVNGKIKPSSRFIQSICEAYNLNLDDFKEDNVVSELSAPYKTELKQVPFDDFMEVEYLPSYAQAGYLSGLEQNHALELQKILVPKEFEKGDYLVVEITGDSMDDNSSKSIKDGDKLLCKELPKDFWDNTLLFRQYLFVILNHEGVVCKQVVSHCLDKHEVVCHSFNDYYKDYSVKLNSIYRLFYVKKIVERKIKF